MDKRLTFSSVLLVITFAGKPLTRKKIQEITSYTSYLIQISATACFLCTTVDAQRIVEQPDPCRTRSRVVGDAEYCDRYWECEEKEPVLFDCPNGLVWVGKDRGIADGCDYPWRNSTLCNNKDLASK